VGLAVGGGIIWLIRLIGGAALKREAMGFGDVTLMAMIGTFVGWQGAIVVFFLAPFAGAVWGIAQWFTRGEHEVPYGPFLCLAACVVVADWPAVWLSVHPYFELGGLFAVLLVVAMALLGLMLMAYRVLRQRLGPANSP
jgi:prepilin signal peptidase PulO-like enzyme (type II secretory pathway)